MVDFSGLGGVPREALASFGEVLDNWLSEDRLRDYGAYPKQRQFHAAGRLYKHRLFRAANQVGKTTAVGAEFAMHLTGLYPSWWDGVRFMRPTVQWATSESGETTRDSVQRTLLGPPGQMGTGMIPKRCLTGVYGRGVVPGLFAYVYVRHVTGGNSICFFRFYKQARESWQSPPVDVVWFDEEPEGEMYHEGVARTYGVNGITMMSFTPKKGYSSVVKMYIDEEALPVGRRQMFTVQMSAYEAEHMTRAQVDAQKLHLMKTSPHEVGPRIYGEPALGEGRIFTADESTFVIAPREVPGHWARLGGLDFGFDHPAAAVEVAWDRDQDVVYVLRDYRASELTPAEHAMVLRHWHENLLWAWPKDGSQTEKGTGEAHKKMWEAEGMNLLPDYAHFHTPARKGEAPVSLNAQSSVSVERGLMEIQQRLASGRLKVFDTCSNFLQEYRLYHRKDGKIVKKTDDVLDAFRVSLMMLRYADTLEGKSTRWHDRGAVDWRIGGY